MSYDMIAINEPAVQDVPNVQTMQDAPVQTYTPNPAEPYVKITGGGQSRCGKLSNAEVQSFLRRRRTIDMLESIFWLLAVVYLFMLIFIKKA